MSRKIWRIVAFTALAMLAGCGRPDAAAPKPHAGMARLPVPPPPAPAAPAAGRFQIVAAPRDSAGIFLLDTATGRVWRLEQKAGLKGARYVWEHMDRLDTNADDYVFRQEHQDGE